MKSMSMNESRVCISVNAKSVTCNAISDPIAANNLQTRLGCLCGSNLGRHKEMLRKVHLCRAVDTVYYKTKRTETKSFYLRFHIL